ncbi:diol dehydratase small subunit [Natranaerofaba carboxydovora]|uniref:diol dehydratase small subunit n=1 Tax=Natranaerofaba carboxydovora TaxID=2742683 RepID=UPI001F13F37A|nr:diol dehydratase small subunit [Natranaerofaba carboxydovora]UMZ73456.1 Propanediol dehydratase small subunit [Natranaerofaba carboxydovora]
MPKLDPKKDFPLGTKRKDLVTTPSGSGIDEITLQAVLEGKIKFEDLRITPETLEYQAQVAEACNRKWFAENLRRAAELTKLPDERLLEIYEALRPYRSTKEELIEIAKELEEKYEANNNASLIRQAAEVYETRKLLKRR